MSSTLVYTSSAAEAARRDAALAAAAVRVAVDAAARAAKRGDREARMVARLHAEYGVDVVYGAKIYGRDGKYRARLSAEGVARVTYDPENEGIEWWPTAE